MAKAKEAKEAKEAIRSRSLLGNPQESAIKTKKMGVTRSADVKRMRTRMNMLPSPSRKLYG